jgi:hypothetical protein
MIKAIARYIFCKSAEWAHNHSSAVDRSTRPLIALCAVLPPLLWPVNSWADDGNASMAALSDAQITRIVTEGYLFAYPAVINYGQLYNQAINRSSKQYIGGFGVFGHYQPVSANNTTIKSPNNDTPYSWAWVDLRAEPYVLTLPEVEPDRYYTSQWNDLWGFIIDNPGAVKDGYEGGRYLLVAPGWQGKTPAGIKRVIRGESTIIGSLTRTGFKGPDDLNNLQAIQQSYLLQPLSQYAGTQAPANIDTYWPIWVNKNLNRPSFFSYLKFLMPFISKQKEDHSAWAHLAQIGISHNGDFDANRLSDSQRLAIQKGIDDANLLLNEGATTAQPRYGDRKTLKTDYINRSLGIIVGPWSNSKQQGDSHSWLADDQQLPLDASDNQYLLHLSAEQVPETDYFWSISLYTLPQQHFYPNDIQRYAIGSNSKDLTINPDGSIDIYIQQQPPKGLLRSNWLPAPAGLFLPVLRSYGPGQDVTGGDDYPPITAINTESQAVRATQKSEATPHQHTEP